ncbi:hypothetical protein [Methylorubrum aminovorans]|uniref:hypothetical protein n=1 Tax=Methylorubrum aminovorans TaxID=269069 RepID=UPI003C2AD916
MDIGDRSKGADAIEVFFQRLRFMECSQVRLNPYGGFPYVESAFEAEQVAHSAQTNREDGPAHPFGNEEVESSILSRSTILPPIIISGATANTLTFGSGVALCVDGLSQDK